MNIRDLEYLVAVHEVSNFSRAAKLCNVSQSTLSGQLKKLEGNLGTSLIERSTRRVLFTPMGETIVEYARGILGGIEKIQTIAKQDEGSMTGDFHFGLIPTVGPFLLPMFMPKLIEQYSEMNLYLYELQTEKLIEKLLKAELDAVILAKQDWNSSLVVETPLYTEKMKLAVSTDNLLAKRGNSIDQKVMEDQTVLMLEEGHCLRNQVLDVCFATGAKEEHRFKATSMDTLLHMVRSGTGITLIPELACDSSQTGVKFLSFNDPVPSREIVMLTRKKTTRSNALEKVAHTIETTVEEFKTAPLRKVIN